MKNANGMGSVSKLPGKRRNPFRATITTGWTEEGKQAKKTIGYFSTITAARKALVMYDVNPVERPNVKLCEIYEEWSNIRFPRLSKSTQNGYKAAYQKLLPLHRKKFTKLRTRHFQVIIDIHSNLSRSSLKKIKTILSLLYDYADENDIVDKNYATYVNLPKGEVKEKEVFDDIEIQKLFTAASDGDIWAQSIVALIYTGFRISAFLSLTSLNYDEQRNILTGGNKTDAGKNRIVPIHTKIKSYIDLWLAKDGETIFCSNKGFRLESKDYRERYYYPTLEKLGIRRLTPHCCRHTFATMLAKSSVSPADIQKLMGHKDYALTANVYTHQDIDTLSSAINKL